MSIDKKLRILRHRSRRTLAQQGQMVGVTANSIYRWEHGLNVPRLRVLKLIAKQNNVSLEWLLSDDVTSDAQSEHVTERLLLSIFRKLPEKSKYKALGYVDRLYIESLEGADATGR